MGNERSKIKKKNRSASVDIASNNINQNASFDSSFLDKSQIVKAPETHKRETLPV